MATAEEIKQDIIDWVNKDQGATYGPDSFASVFYDFIEEIAWKNAVLELRSGPAKVVEFKDAGEGDYSAATLLILSVGGQLFRVDGQYESWAGTEWEANDLYEVEPVPVLVTQYQRKVL